MYAMSLMFEFLHQDVPCVRKVAVDLLTRRSAVSACE